MLLAKQCARFLAAAEKYDNSTLADKMKVDTSVICKIRKGRAPTFDQILRLAKLTDRPPEYLLGLTGPKGWRLENADHPTVRVARLDSFEAIKKRPFADESIKRWIPYLVQDLEWLTDGEVQTPKQFAELPVAGGHILVDHYFRLKHISTNELFIMQHRGELSVCRIAVFSDEIICTTQAGRLIRSGLSPHEAMYKLLVARVLSRTVRIRELDPEPGEASPKAAEPQP